jgi:hypothetical protein
VTIKNSRTLLHGATQVICSPEERRAFCSSLIQETVLSGVAHQEINPHMYITETNNTNILSPSLLVW